MVVEKHNWNRGYPQLKPISLIPSAVLVESIQTI